MAKKELKTKQNGKNVETKEERMEIVKKFTDEVLKKHGKLIKAVVMMGSVAREEFKPMSDIDVFVIIDDTQNQLTPDMHDKIDEELEQIAEKIPGAIISVKTPDGKEEKTWGPEGLLGI